MLSLFTTFLPYILTGYFLFRAYKDPIFIIGIPFLMFLGPSIFFDNAVLFLLPFRSFESIGESSDILLLTWFAISYIIFKFRTNKFSENNIGIKYAGNLLNALDYFVVSLMIITLIGLGLVLNEFYVVENVFDKFFIISSLFVGFFILKDIVRNTNAEVLEKFLFSIVVVNSIASGLYFIHQGLHIGLYASHDEYLTEIVNGELITRTFWFMPVLCFFSISFLLVMKNKNKMLNLFLISVNVLAIYISYTRSFLLIAVLLFLLYFFLEGFKNRSVSKVIKGFMVVGFFSFVLFMIVSSLLPTSTKYFIDRFKDLNEKPANAKSNNLVYRFYKTDRIINKMNAEKVLFGYGSVTQTQLPFVKMVDNATADMGWAEVVFRWGYLGLVLFILLYVIAIIKAFFLFLRTEGLISQLALILLLTIISQAIEGFTSFTIMYPGRFPLGLWYFGILSALTIADISKENREIVEIEET